MNAYIIPGIRPVENIIGEIFGTSTEAIMGKSRDRNIVEARQTAIWYYMKYKGYSQHVCGKYFNRNPSTTHYAKKQVEVLYTVDKIFRSKVDEVVKRCNFSKT